MNENCCHRLSRSARLMDSVMTKRTRSRVVLGIGRSKLAAKLAEEFRSKGWDVQTTMDGEEARRVAVRESAQAVVVPFEQQDELTTAKVVQSVPDEAKVVLVTPNVNERAIRFASLIGVPLAVESLGVAGIVSAVEVAVLLKV